jgi:hypothetical protein
MSHFPKKCFNWQTFYFLIFEILFFQERSEEKDGRITTETKRHEHHEEIDDNEEPEDDRPASDTSSIHEVVKETRNNYTTLQDEDQVSFRFFYFV